MGIATTTQTKAVRDLSDQNSQGTRLGVTSADLIGFYGATSCIAQSSIIGALTLASATASAFSTGGSTSFGFSSASIATAVLNAVVQLQKLGLIN
jgi:hypothetical protein